MQRSISIGIFDWGRFVPDGDYYPEDMPAEWRLSFFSNDFESACVSLSQFAHNHEQLLELTEDPGDSFQLSFYLQQVEDVELLLELIAQNELNPQFLVIDEENLQSIQDRLAQSSMAEDFERKSLTRDQLFCSRDRGEEASNVYCLPFVDSLAQIRTEVETWLRVLPDPRRNLTLWLDGSKVDAKTLTQSRTLLELMGY